MPRPNAFYKTRIAPTPSGFLHLGNAYSFLLTEALAKKYQANILLRIDDMDRERSEDTYVLDIFDTLNFLGINWQEGPKDMTGFKADFSQIHRLSLYNNILEKLKEKGCVYACTCSRSEILKKNKNGFYDGTCRHKNIPLESGQVNWRLNTSEKLSLRVKTLQGYTDTFLPDSMNDFVVRKKDGLPAYQLTSLADDLYFEVDLIVRGEDLWASTLAQLYLAAVLNEDRFLNSTFHHHPLLLSHTNEKLSKSAGDTSIQFLRSQGKTVDEIKGMLPGFII